MAKGIHSKYRSRAGRPSPQKATSHLHTHARTPADLAERDLLAAILDAAAEDGGVERDLLRITAHLAKYAKCSCVGIILFTDEDVLACTSSHGGTAEFTRIPRGTFPASERRACSSMLRGQSDIHMARPTAVRPFVRNSRPAASVEVEAADRPFGICVGSTFESVALIPVRDPKAVAGLILIGDERKDRIPRRKIEFLERVGGYVGNMIGAVEARDKLDRLNQDLRGTEGNAPTSTEHVDEMELLTRLIENSNEAIVITQDWRIIYVNKKCAEGAGLPKEDLVGLPLLDMTHPDDRQEVRERYSRILNGEWFSSGTVLRGLDKDGNTRWAELREIPFAWHGRPAVMSLVNDITDRKRAEEALAESERHYRFLADNTTDVIWVTDMNLKPTYLSPSVTSLLGYSVEEGMSGSAEERLPPASAKVATEAFVDALAREKQNPGSGKSRTIELEMKRKDGSTVWVDTTVSFVRDSEGQAIGILGAMRDMTERRRARETLRASEEKYRLLTEKTNDIIWTSDLDLRTTFVSSSVERLAGYTVEERMTQKLTDMMTPECLAKAAEALNEQLAKEQEIQADPNRTLKIDLEYYRKDGSTFWLENHVSGLRDANGTLIGFHGVARDVTDRRKAEEALRQSEAKYKDLFEHTLLGMEVVDGQAGKTVLANRSLARMFGFKSPADLVGTNPLDYVLPEDRDWVVSQIAQLMNDPTWAKTAEIRARTEDGRVIWLTGLGTPIDYEGRPAMLLSLVEITAAKEAEARLHESEERYRLVVENANEGIAVVQDGALKFTNPRFADATGYSVEELLSKPFSELIHPDDRQMVFDYYFRRLKGQEVPRLYQCRFLDKAGNTNWIEVNAVLFTWEGRTATLALLGDITERRKAEEALKASEERFRTLIEEATDAIAIVDGNGRLLYESPSMERVTGYKLDGWQGTPMTDWFLHPDDLAALASLMERLLTHPGASSEEVRVRFKHKDGLWHFLEGTVRNLLGDPKVNGLVINYRDVTDRVKADLALRESEERFRALAENSSDLIVLLDRNGVISYESPAAGRLLGLTPEERVGERPFDRVHSEDLVKATGTFAELMRDPQAGPKRVDALRLQHKDGSWRIMEATGSAILRDGEVQGIVVNLHDITERKSAEAALKASEERFRTIIENARDAITIVDEDFNVMYESPSLGTATGYLPEEWLGKSLADMQIHPDDVPLLAFEFEKLKSQPQGVVEDVCVRYKHPDGSWHVIEATARNLLHDPAVKGIVVNFRDITERKHAEEARRESELRYRLLAENASDVIFTSDLAMKLTYVSPSIVQLTGYSPEETMSQDVDSWVAPASKDFVSKSFAWAVDKAVSGIELPRAMRTSTMEMLKKEGGTVWAEIRIDFLRDADGRPIGILGVARDITDRRIAEMELERRVQLETMITEISTTFIGISTDYIDQGIQNALESISRFTEVDRSYIFTFNEDRTSMRMAHEWSSKGIEPLIGRLHSLQANSLPFLVERIKSGDCVHISDPAELPATAEAERRLLLNQGAQSVVVVPMLQEGHAVGFLGLSLMGSKKIWDEETIMLLRLVAEMFSNALERKRMDLALRESERRYRLLAENASDVIWTTDMQTNITYMSPSATRLVGFSMEELGDMTVGDLLTPDSYERGMKALAEQQANVTQQRDAPPDHWTLEVQLRRKDGSAVWVEEKVAFLRDEKGTPVGLVGVTRDISERKAIEDSLRLSEDKYRTMVEASPDGVLSIDGRGIIADCNTGLCRMLGYDRKLLCGREARLLGTKKDLDAEPYYHDHMARGEYMEVETDIVRHDGSTLPVWAKMVRLTEPSTNDIQTIIYFRDIADRRKIDEMKDEFVGLVSHELRSPLTVIIGALNTAISEGPRLSQKETRQLLEDAATEAEQLSHLVGNLLELSRAQANRLFLHVEPINMDKAVHKVIGSIERQSSKHRFIVDLPKRLPPVSADQLRLERILYNLLENSVKYSPEGSEITVSAKRRAGQLVVSVSDQGPGISKEDQAKLFKPFQQLGDPMLDHTKGAGLGLLVCRRLVEAHGGRIWVESEPGHGASFRFTLEPSIKDDPDAR